MGASHHFFLVFKKSINSKMVLSFLFGSDGLVMAVLLFSPVEITLKQHFYHFIIVKIIEFAGYSISSLFCMMV